jgi:branched-chain amino acid transport system permease protein
VKRLLGDRALWELGGPALLVVLVAVCGSFTSRAVELQVQSVLVTAAIVVGLYVFVGNSGVLSFGHVSFVALGAFAAGISSSPAGSKASTFPELFPFLAELEVSNVVSLLLAAAIGGVAALLVGVPIVRLSGLSAGIATFAVLIITNNVLRNWERIGPGAKTLPLVPRTTGFAQAAGGLLIVMAVAYAFQRSRFGRMVRAAREDAAAGQAVGIDDRLQRLIAFTLSGVLSGFAGGLLVHLLGSITTQQVYLDLTFTTLAMLVVGGIGSLWGAVLGGLAVAGLDAFLAEAERGVSLGVEVTIPAGTRLVAVGLVMLVILMVRPRGLTGSQELRPPFGRAQRQRRLDDSSEPSRNPEPAPTPAPGQVAAPHT